MSKATCIVMLVLASCAMGGNSTRSGDDASSPGHDDAPSGMHLDAAIPKDAAEVSHDASVPHDAAVPHDAPVDADQGGFCSGNDQCGSGYCCYIAFCVEGTAVGALCFPDGN